MKNKRNLIIYIAVVILAVFLFSACSSALNEAANLQAYDFGADQIPTVNYIVGTRTVTNVETSTSPEALQKQYTYRSDSEFEDLLNYTIYLRYENGWIVTQEYDLNDVPGTAQLAKNSVDAGKILILSIAYESGAYAIKITKADGTIDIN